MSYSNIASKLILNGKGTHGAYPSNSALEDGMIFLKYAWEVKITDDDTVDLSSAPPLVAKTCELPKFTIDSQVVNVYNHKTIVQTKMTYEPITISFYDQAGGAVEKLIWGHVKNQFDSSDGSKAAMFKPLTIEITMKNLSGPGATSKVYTLTNAFITDAQHDTLDYSTSEAVLWTITVRYEDLQTGEFSGSTPVAKTGIPAQTPFVATHKNSVDKVPVTTPPKADAISNNEAPSPMYTDPMGTTDGAAIMAAVENAPSKPSEKKAWPVARPNNSSYPANASAPVTPRPTSGWQAQQVWDSKYASGWNADGTSKTAKGYTPSTGTPASSIASGTDTTDSGFNPEYLKARNDYLKTHPPRTNSAQSKLAAEHVADAAALRVAPRYSVQTRTVNADGSFTDRANITPAGISTSDSAKSQGISNVQAQREQTLQNQKASASKGY
jgi:hypothetical protein